jgi:hypothetical protein
VDVDGIRLDEDDGTFSCLRYHVSCYLELSNFVLLFLSISSVFRLQMVTRSISFDIFLDFLVQVKLNLDLVQMMLRFLKRGNKRLHDLECIKWFLESFQSDSVIFVFYVPHVQLV